MRWLFAITLAACLGCAPPCPAQTVEAVGGRCRCGQADGHKFGMQWDGEQAARLLRAWPQMERFLDGWIHLPDRLERAFWWGGAWTATSSLLLFQAILVVLWLATRKK